MTQKKQTTGMVTFPPMPKILSPDAVYDMLMRNIEPELASDAVNGLKEKYKNEKPDQAKKRAERYAAAFEEYDRRLDAYITDLNKAMSKYVREAAKSLESYDRQIDADTTLSLEMQMFS